MANKKIIDLGFTPSPYQEKIFHFVQHGVGNCVIKACAGSGKSTTIVSAMKLVPKSKKCLFIAFNKSIVEELTRRLDGYDNCVVKTIHSLGYLIVRRNLGSDIEIDEYKYRTYLKKHINELTSITEGTYMTRQMVEDYIDSITMLIDYSRFNIAQSVKEIEQVAARYDIPVSFDECEVALKCLKWGEENYHTIDYTDMVWLPYELSLKPTGLQFDWIFFDEAQDASQMAIELFLRCFKRGTRFASVGDSSQTINLFAGSSPEAFDYMCNYPNTTIFELPVTYRCAKKITEYANNLVPNMKYRDDAPDGMVIDNCHINAIKDGDMVLARSKAPLLKLYVKLLRRGINCYIKGQDIGSNLIKILENVDLDELNADLKKDGVFVRLYDKLFNDRNKLMEKRGLDMNDATLSMNIMNMYDSINALIILSEKYNSKHELIEHIKDIFKDNSKGVCLSTIHKAKGLEAENVYILCHSMMPSKLAHHDWEKIQERNLQYVAYTRPKNKLGFISEKEIPPSGSMLEPTAILDELKYIENKICKILGKTPMQPMNNAEIAKFNLKNATQIKDLHEKDNRIDISNNSTEKCNNDMLLEQLLEFMKKSDNSTIEKIKKTIKIAEQSRGI
jgi:superfamily I DNA/RNA helicase